MKKHLSLMLVFLLLLGMTATASTQGTVNYYNQDFSSYDTVEQFVADTATITTTFPKGVVSTVSNFSNYVNSGKRMSTTLAATWLRLNTNANGQKYIASAFGGDEIPLCFIPENEWTAVDNQTYVISFNLERTADAIGTAYNFLAIMGNSGEDYSLSSITSYSGGSLWTCYTSHVDNGLNNAVGTGHGIVEVDVPKRFALSFEKAAGGNLVRNGYSTNEQGAYAPWYVGTERFLESTTSVAAFGVNLKSVLPAISDLNMYVINTDYDFKVEPVNNNAVATTAKSYKFKFSRPIAHDTLDTSLITMKKGTEDFTDFTVGEVKNEIIGTEVCTTVEIKFSKTFEPNRDDYSIIVPSTVKDEIATEIGTTNNVVTFSTGSHPSFEVDNFTADGLVSDDLDVLENKNTVFNAIFRNNGAAANAMMFIGIYDSNDTLVGYTFADTSFSAGEAKNFAFGTKIEETGMYAKALTFGCVEDFANDISFSTTYEIN